MQPMLRHKLQMTRLGLGLMVWEDPVKLPTLHSLCTVVAHGGMFEFFACADNQLSQC